MIATRTRQFIWTALRRPTACLLFALGALLCAQSSLAAPGEWILTGNLNTGRSGQTATLLQDARVLVVGGFGGGAKLSSAELYNPGTGTWTPTGSVNAPRQFHTATLLPNGMVLVVGGQAANLEHLKTAELYDPATGTWSFTGSLKRAATITAPPSCRTELFSPRQATAAQALATPPNCITPRPAFGRPPVTSMPFESSRPPISCKTARSSSRADTPTTPLSPPPNFTTPPPEPGPPPAA